MSTPAKPNELKLTRVYDAPVRAVWEAWTDTEQVAQWWGPRGFTITTHSKDLRPGGHWSYTMHGPDGTDYENKTIYHEVEECAKLVYDHGGNDDRPPLFRVTVLFHEEGGKTTMEMTMAVATPEAIEHIRKVIKQANGNSTWDRLAEYLEKEDTGKERFVINRTFAASPEAVFSMWADPAHIAQWLPPKGFTMEFLTTDVRPGGRSFYRMSNGEMTMYGASEYLVIEPPARLVYRQQFCDEHGAPGRHPMAPLFPETMLTSVEFVAEEPGSTRVTVTCEPYRATAEEISVFTQARGGMTVGWNSSFDELEETLGVR
ncbi:MAG TPA: SRPBCC family protein [Chthoniobacterales bacterium]|jgi:uncharacterized protein YndB with AHSA1/START domain|nr:SRPBCC family protein [Chthoniobacterales bacterium]